MSLKQLLISMAMMSIVVLVGCGTDSEISKETQSQEESSIAVEAETSIFVDVEIERPTETQIYHARMPEEYDMGSYKDYWSYGYVGFDAMQEDSAESTNNAGKHCYTYDCSVIKWIDFQYYQVESLRLNYVFEEGKGGVLDIGGTKVQTSIVWDIGSPEIYGNDFNRDGTYDFIIIWRNPDYMRSISILSDGDTYKELVLKAELPDIKITALDDYKMKVVSKACGVDAEYVMENHFAYDMLNTYKLYFDFGKLAYTGYNIPVTDMVPVEAKLYALDMFYSKWEHVVAVKNMVKSNDHFTGISVIYYYIFSADGSMKTEVKMVNENWRPY